MGFLRNGIVIGLLVAAPVTSQGSDDDIQQDVEILKKGQAEIQKQLEEIKKLLQARPAAAPAAPSAPAVNIKDMVFDLGENPIKGQSSARLTLIEFTDYQCPYCSQYVRETYPQIAKEYIDTGKLRYALIDLPLAMHKSAFDAAEATRCAADQKKYWEMHDRLFANQRALEPWTAHAEAVGLDAAKFEQCMQDDRHAAAIRAGMAQAQGAGITGTPSFVLALTDPADPRKAKGVSYLGGAHPFSSFKNNIEQALAGN